MLKKLLISGKGFTLIELLVVISIIGFIAVSSTIMLNIARMNTRDATRVANITMIRKALTVYFNENGSYPVHSGTNLCLTAASGAGLALKNANTLLIVPVDPLWPTAAPAHFLGTPTGSSTNFCYFYYRSSATQYILSFYLETDSQSRFGFNQGRNITNSY